MELVSICHCTHAVYIYRSESFGGDDANSFEAPDEFDFTLQKPGTSTDGQIMMSPHRTAELSGLSFAPTRAVTGLQEISQCPEKVPTM